MLTKPNTIKAAVTIYSQFSLNGIDVIDPDHLPEDYPFVWITNAIRSDEDISQIIADIAKHFNDTQLSVVNISHLFSNEYAILIFYRNVNTFSRFADHLYHQYQVNLRSDVSSKIISYPKSSLLHEAASLEDQAAVVHH